MEWYHKSEGLRHLFQLIYHLCYGRRSTAEYIRFLNIAQGSLNELETHIILSQRVGLCSQADIESIIFLLREENRMIVGLIKKLQQ